MASFSELTRLYGVRRNLGLLNNTGCSRSSRSESSSSSDSESGSAAGSLSSSATKNYMRQWKTWPARIRIFPYQPSLIKNPRSASKQSCGSWSRIRCLFDPWIRDPGSGMNNPEFRNHFFWVKINSLMRIRDGDTSDPGWKKVGSEINIPDPQHCIKE